MLKEELLKLRQRIIDADLQKELDIVDGCLTGPIDDTINTNLYNIDLSGADLSGITFSNVNLYKANLSTSKLTNTRFYGANLVKTNFTGANLIAVSFIGLDLSCACFKEASLVHVDFELAKLQNADFRDAAIDSVNMRSADLTRADFSGAKICRMACNKAKFSETKGIHFRIFREINDMTSKQRMRNIIDTLSDFNIPVLGTKNDDYSDENDADFFFKGIKKWILATFVRDCIPNDRYYVWSVLFEKRIVAIKTWIEKRNLRSEDIRMKIVDTINYLFILWTLIEDDHGHD